MLKRVKIQGYKSLVDVEVKLQPLTVLFGPNASGKSNFLDALQLLSRIATSNNLNDAFYPPYRGAALESFTFGADGIPGLLAQEKVSFSIEVDVEISHAVVDAVNSQLKMLEAAYTTEEKYLRYRIEIELAPKIGIPSIAHEEIVELNENGEPTKQRIWMGRDHTDLYREGGSTHFDSAISHSILALPYYIPHYVNILAMRQELSRWLFYYLEPREHMRISNPVKEVRYIGQMGEEIAAFLNTLRAINARQFGAVEKALHTVVPSITGIDVGINSSGEVELKLMEGKTPISSRVVSDGTLRILGLLALTGVKDQPTLLGLEEPENGIHPRRIDLIARFLETQVNSDTQVIATTHSAVLIDLIPHGSLYVCRKRKRQTTIEPFSRWEYPDVSKSLDKEELHNLPVSERLLRGDFDA